MKAFFTTFYIILSFSYFQLKAQNIRSISGKVVNAAHEPMIGNALLLSVPDATVIKGAGFSDGIFKLSEVGQKEIFVKLTSVMFADTILKVSYKGRQDIDLGAILLDEYKNQLTEVRISAPTTPLIKYTANGNVLVNVAGTILASSNTVSEILSRSPGIMEDGAGFSVFGKGEAIIYLNGRQITTEQLAAVPTSQIARIEIISNPSSKYDAQGKAVINVVTNAKIDEGVMGTISQYFSSSDFGGNTANSFADLSYRKGKFSLVGNYAILTGETRERLHTTRTRSLAAEYLNSDLWTDWNRRLKNYSTFGLGTQYNINETSVLSLAYNGSMENQGGSQDSRNKLTTNEGENSYASNIKKKELRWNHSVILNYTKTFDTLGSSFFAGSQFSRYHADVNDFIDEQSITNAGMDIANRQLMNDVGHVLTISTTQVDYAKLYKEGQKLETGAKMSYVRNNSVTDFLIGQPGTDFLLDKDLSNSFSYVERIPAAYINYSGVLGQKINFNAGLRGEYTSYELKTSAGAGRNIKDNYLNVFPNFSLNTSVAGDLVKLRLSYAARITRPRYQSLNPLVIYQDPFTTIEGNPDLVPEKTHAFEFGANYRDFDFKAGYTYSIDPFSAAALRGEKPNSYVLKALNLDGAHLFFSSVSKTFRVARWWTSLNTVNLSITKQVDHKYNFELFAPKPQIYLYTSNTFNVNGLFRLQLLAWYTGERYSGLYHNNSIATVTAGIEKDFLENKLKLKFTANDIFHQSNVSGNYTVGQTEVFFDRTLSTNYFRLIAAYSFGKLKKSNYNNKTTGQQENNRAN